MKNKVTLAIATALTFTLCGIIMADPKPSNGNRPPVKDLSDLTFSTPPEEIAPHGKGSTPVLFTGDSMMAILGKQAERAFKRAKIQPVASFSSLGSGLCRPSVFNWNNKIDELIKEHNPKMIVIALGTNDRQPIEIGDDKNIPYSDTKAWSAAYAKAVGSVNEQFINGGAEKIVWLLPPDMQKKENQEHCALIRHIIISEALREERAGKVQVFDLAPILSAKPGVYSRYKMSPAGEALSVRDPDGIHLAIDGAKLVAQSLLKQYFEN